jgi:hypothetical protein
VGLLPTLLVSEENTADIATLLATPAPSNPAQYLKLELAGQTFYLDLSQATQLEERAAFEELLEALPPSATLYRGTNGGWETESIAPADLAEQLELPFAARTFSDVAESPFAREINTLATYELLSGYEDGTFRPENAITRAEFCAMVATALDLPANENALTFSDTPADAWFADAVSAMSTRGFIAGYEDGTFRPDSTITYQEMVTILSAVAAWSNMNSYDACQEKLTAADKDTYSQFADWAQSAARNLDQLDALVGNQTPDEAGTRQVAAGLLCTLMENINLLWD